MLLLVGCNITKDLSFIVTEIPDLEIETPKEAAKWISKNIKYQADGEQNNWKAPQRTYFEGYGDCEDFTTLWMYLVEEQTEYTDTYFIGGEWLDKPGTYHAYGWHNDLYYEPQAGWYGKEYLWATDILKYSYKTVMLLAVIKEIK